MRRYRHLSLVIAALLAVGIAVWGFEPPDATPDTNRHKSGPVLVAVVRSSDDSAPALAVSIGPRPQPLADQLLALTRPIVPAAPASAAPASSNTTSPAGGVWAQLRWCESRGDYAEDTGNGYFGAYQFSLSTWDELGLTGLPSQASQAVQDLAAQTLEARQGWRQWPGCSTALGLT